MTINWRQFIVALTVMVALLVVVAGEAAHAEDLPVTIVTGPPPVFTATGDLTSCTLLVEQPAASGGGLAPTGSAVTVFIKDSGGTIISTVSTTVGAGGLVPITVPAGAGTPGHKIELLWTNPTTLRTHDSLPIVWKFDKTKPAKGMKIDPFGIPGLTPVQSWFIMDPQGVTFESTSGTSATALASNFDLRYSPIGTDLFKAFILGENSFISLSDKSVIGFPDGLFFGTVQISDINPINTAGTLNFTGLGFEGTWTYDPVTNYTGAVASFTDSFDAPTIGFSTVPEPSNAYLVGIGLFGLAATGLYRKRKREALRAG